MNSSYLKGLSIDVVKASLPSTAKAYYKGTIQYSLEA